MRPVINVQEVLAIFNIRDLYLKFSFLPPNPDMGVSVGVGVENPGLLIFFNLPVLEELKKIRMNYF